MQFGDIMLNCSIFKFSPDSQFYGACQSSKLYIKVSSIKAENLSIINASSIINQFQFSPDSKKVAVFLQKKSQINVYKINGEIIAAIEDTLAGITGMMWVKDSVQLITFSDFNYKCSIYNLSNKTVTYIREPKINGSKGCSFTNDGKFMSLIERHDCKDYLAIYYTIDWKLVNVFLIQMFDAVEVRWSPNNAFILVWDNCINYKLHIFDPLRGITQKIQPYQYAMGIKTVDYSRSSLFVSVGSCDEKVRVFNALTWKLISELDCSTSQINSNSVCIYKEEENQRMTIKKYTNQNYKIPTLNKNTNDKTMITQGVTLLQFSYDDSFLACKNENMPHTIWIWNVSKMQLYTLITFSTTIKMFKWSQKDNELWIVPGNERIVVWRDQEIQECRFPFQNRKFNIVKIKWSSDSRKILASDKNDLLFMEFTR